MHSLVSFCRAVAAALMLVLIISGSQPVQAQGSTTVVISEFRTRGPAGANDEFVQVTNISASSVDISGYTLRGSNNAATVGIRSTVPASTTLPPGGHYLFVNDQATGTNEYSLTAYAAGNATFTTGVTDDGGVAIFAADGTTIVDQVGMSAGSAYKEGTTLTPMVADTVSDYSYVRRLTTGVPQDTNDNTADFVLVSTDGNVGAVVAALGAPGPENLASPVQRNTAFKASLIDPGAAPTAIPNRARNGPATGTNAAFGTLTFRRRFTNSTGVSVTRLRFRIVNVTAGTAPAGTADLRALSSTSVTVTLSSGGMLFVQGTTLETPPAQPNGGGLNSTLAAGTVTEMTPIANGAAIDLQFVLGVQQEGTFRFFINVEALPVTTPAPIAASKTQATGKRRALKGSN